MTLSRRRFLATGAAGILVVAAPAIAREGVLMPVRALPKPVTEEWYRPAVNTEALMRYWREMQREMMEMYVADWHRTNGLQAPAA